VLIKFDNLNKILRLSNNLIEIISVSKTYKPFILKKTDALARF
jgi:hypothetical protein